VCDRRWKKHWKHSTEACLRIPMEIAKRLVLREIILSQEIQMPPGGRRPMGHRLRIMSLASA
jgi:hypothetical protein